MENLITCAEAAEMLGYKTSKSVRDLIQRGHLSFYKKPLARKILVDRKEVETLNAPKLIKERVTLPRVSWRHKMGGADV